MKRTAVLLTLLLFAFTLFLSFSGGPGTSQQLDVTGGPLSQDGNTYCTMCHSGGDFGTMLNLTVVSEAGDTISEYEPSTAYTLQVSILAEGASGYGFQAVALDENNVGSGMFADTVGGTQVVTLNNVNYIEHSSRAEDGTWEIPWTSPDVGTGAVTFYAAGNAVNNSFSPAGDDPDTAFLVLEEALGAGIANVQEAIALKLSPNPTVDYLRIQWSAQEVVPEELQIVSATGQLMQERAIHGLSNNLEVAVNDLPSGIYFVRMASNEGIQTKRFIKL